MALGLDDVNAIVIQRYDIGVAIDRGKPCAGPPELGGIVKRLTRKRARGTRVKRGGLPGFEYRVPIVKPVKARSVLTFLFDGRRESVHVRARGGASTRLRSGPEDAEGDPSRRLTCRWSAWSGSE